MRALNSLSRISRFCCIRVVTGRCGLTHHPETGTNLLFVAEADQRPSEKLLAWIFRVVPDIEQRKQVRHRFIQRITPSSALTRH